MNLSEEWYRRLSSRFVIFVLLAFVMIISSCIKKKDTKSNLKNPDNISLKEAKYFDIPLPIGYKFIYKPKPWRRIIDYKKNKIKKILPEDFSKNSEFIVYLGNLDIERLVNYYNRNMDLFGWEVINLSNDQEGLLICNKLNKCCVVSIRNDMNICKDNSGSCICLFIKNNLHNEGDDKKDINSKKICKI